MVTTDPRSESDSPVPSAATPDPSIFTGFLFPLDPDVPLEYERPEILERFTKRQVRRVFKVVQADTRRELSHFGIGKAKRNMLAPQKWIDGLVADIIEAIGVTAPGQTVCWTDTRRDAVMQIVHRDAARELARHGVTNAILADHPTYCREIQWELDCASISRALGLVITWTE